MNRFKLLLAEYGRIAIATYLALFVLSMVTFGLVLGLGFEVNGVSSGTGVLFGAWAATKLIQPLRVGAALLLTPIVARVLRFKGKPAEPSAQPDAVASSPAPLTSRDDLRP